LVRKFTVPVLVDFIRVASYGFSTSSFGKIHLAKEIEIDKKNQDVLVVADRIDTGLTLNHIILNYKKWSIV